MKAYVNFLLTILVSMLVMHALMYLNTWELAHVEYSQTRAWMTLIMGAGMMLVMLVAMRHMYRDKAANAGIVALAVVLLGVGTWGVRSQRFVDDVDYMKAMIPHHSIALLTSRRARIEDPRVRELADQIIAAQEAEIARMQSLIEELEAR